MLIGVIAIIFGGIIYFSNQNSNNDERYFGDDIEINVGSIILLIIGLVLIVCDIFDLWVYK